MTKRINLKACPVLERPVWDEEDVLVAADWALQRGHELAEKWWSFPPATVRMALEHGVDPSGPLFGVVDPIAHLMSQLEVDEQTAIVVHGLIGGTLDPEGFESVERWVRQCYHRPSQNELIMRALNEVLDGHGVEAIRVDAAWVDAYHHDVVGTFVNMGDAYAGTIVLDSETGEFIPTTWGDFVETWEREHPIDPGGHPTGPLDEDEDD